MTTQAPKKILLTGATGYIGGSVLTTLLNSTVPSLKEVPITLLLRGKDRADTFTAKYGDRVRPILYEGMDDLDRTIEVAAQHDIVINTTMGDHPGSSAALVKGLAQRKKLTNSEPWIIHTSGTSNVSDRPITNPMPIREWDDSKDDVYSFEKELEAKEPYGQRTSELAVVDTGLEFGIKTLVIMSPVIYGIGTGLYKKIGASIFFLRGIVSAGSGLVVGKGDGVWNHVHIEDVADLYVLILRKLVENGGAGVPTGKKGIIFSANGDHSRLEQTKDAVEGASKHGLISDTTISHIDLNKGSEIFGPSLGITNVRDAMDRARSFVETAFVSNARTVATIARNLGWKPSKGEDAWKQHDSEDSEVIKKEEKKE
jgi:nucleoside-diphosphate-sugar epimerase